MVKYQECAANVNKIKSQVDLKEKEKAYNRHTV